jgi:Fic family protein
MPRKPLPAPTISEMMSRLDPDVLRDVLMTPLDGAATPGGKYRHWNDIRHLSTPSGLTREQWWLRIKLARGSMRREYPLQDTDGLPFVFSTPDQVLEHLHFIDQRAAGEVAMPEVVLGSEGAKQRYLVNSLIEEAIRSSQLEGAATSHRVAKAMIKSGRKPSNRSEQMIFNNYVALEYIREQADADLSPDIVFTLHRILTDGTLDNPDAAGRLQRPDEDRVVVMDPMTGYVFHEPPPAEQLPERLDRLCDFANGITPHGGFLHPVLRAVLVHFWIGFEHPFEDGNGRTARALFYWSMRRENYWLAEYLSISRILRLAPSKYIMSYLLTESDERDTTYFVIYQLAVIKRAIEELYQYLVVKQQEVRDTEQLIRRSNEFNYRQLALLAGALRNPAQTYTIESHRASHRVVYQTARTDLLDLRDRGLLTVKRVGKKMTFSPVPGLADRLGDLGNP